MVALSLKKFVYLSIVAALLTITLKLAAYFLTNSVGLLSDAMESCVNLVDIEKDIRNLFPDAHTTVFTHLEPVEDQESMLDINIDRK